MRACVIETQKPGRYTRLEWKARMASPQAGPEDLQRKAGLKLIKELMTVFKILKKGGFMLFAQRHALILVKHFVLYFDRMQPFKRHFCLSSIPY
jgi:hypothetical protein